MIQHVSGGHGGSPTEGVWSAVREQLRGQMDPKAFQSWVAGVEARENGSTVLIACPNKFVADYVRHNIGYQIRVAWSELDPLDRPLEFGVAPGGAAQGAEAPSGATNGAGPDAAPAASSPAAASPQAVAVAAPRAQPRMLGGRVCSFENFVTAPSNEFALAAAREVARSPHSATSLLFVHGGYGFGKSHLMHALANAVEQRGDRALVYTSGERFTSEFCESIGQKDTAAFKARMRGADLLILDDVQMIEGKRSTQEEFFHTIAELVNDGRQVVITADRSPAELEGLSPRIRSLLAGGVCCDVGAADLDLRQRILDSVLAEMHARQSWIDMPADARGFLAARVTASPRELLGALRTLVARAAVHKQPMSIDWVMEALVRHGAAETRRVSVDQIQKAVAQHFDIRVAELLSPRRTRAIAQPRQIAMYLAKELTTRSYPDLGRRFGGRDHTTIIHGVRRIAELMKSDPQIAEAVSLLRRQLES